MQMECESCEGQLDIQPSSDAFPRFLLVKLHMDSLERKHTRRQVRQALEELPGELDGTYNEALERIRGQSGEDRQLAERVLSWITYAREPLSVGGLRHALATEQDTTLLNDDDLIDQEVLLSVCLGLVVIDDESSIIRLVRM